MATDWTDEELRAAVSAYFEMQEKHASSQPFNKKQYYRDLSATYGRTEKAFEYRMQNISFVLSQMGRDWLPGLVPAKNVGTSVAAGIQRIINDFETKVRPQRSNIQTGQSQSSRPNQTRPAGVSKPAASSTSVITYARDESVKDWVLNRADGVCEACSHPAPFLDAAKKPFLEVHHVRPLAEGGSDTVTNTVALCPNCHRELHYGQNRLAIRQVLYGKVRELEQE